MDAIWNHVKSLSLLILTEDCFDIFFSDKNFLHGQCLKYAVSKILGYGIILGSVLVKLPQIMKIIQNQSATGISIIGQMLELYGVTASVAYNYAKGFPFSSWGDGVFMLGQTMAIAALTYHYNYSDLICVLFLAIFTGILSVIFAGVIAIEWLWAIQASSVPVMFVGKMTQAFQNYRQQSVGQLSLATTALLTLGSLARVFTSVQETGDFIIVLTFGLATFANSLVLFQFYLYPATNPMVKVRRSKALKRKLH